MKKLILLASLTIACSGTALAQSQHSVSPKISTLGLGVEYMYRYSDQLSFGGGIYAMSLSRNFDENKVDYDAKLNLRNLAALVQYSPWGSGFRINGGLVFNANKVDIRAIPKNASFTFNDHVYTTDQIGSANGEIDFNNVAPYLGIGWSSGNPSQKGFAFTFDAGVMYSGAPDISLTANCRLPTIHGIDACSQIRRDLEAERVDIQDSFDKYKLYPVLSVGFTYRF